MLDTIKSLLPSRSTPAPRPTPEAEATLAELIQSRDIAKKALDVADEALDTALIDRADGRVGGDAVAKAYKAQREAKEAYELATRGVEAGESRVVDSTQAEAHAAENSAWDRLAELMEQRVALVAKLESSVGFFIKSYGEVEESNNAIYKLSHTPDGRVRLDRDDMLLTHQSLRDKVYKEIQRLGGGNFFKTPPPYEELQPISVAYKTAAQYLREVRARFFK